MTYCNGRIERSIVKIYVTTKQTNKLVFPYFNGVSVPKRDREAMDVTGPLIVLLPNQQGDKAVVQLFSFVLS